jgi:hypothetical protein
MTFGLKCKTRIGLWNVRILTQSVKLKKIWREMENYKMELDGLHSSKGKCS